MGARLAVLRTLPHVDVQSGSPDTMEGRQTRPQSEQSNIQRNDLCKLVLIGDCCTGKSCVLSRFGGRKDFYSQYIATIGLDFSFRSVDLNDSQIKLLIWDTSGQERFRTIAREYCQESGGIIIFYDVGRKKTFDNVPYWVQEARKYGRPRVVLMIVGTKSDVIDKREVTYEAAKAFADEEDLLLFEVSAKDGTNTDLALITLVAKIKNH